MAGTWVAYKAALLGAVTSAANNHEVTYFDDNGAQMKKIVRDSTGVRHRARLRRTSAPSGDLEATDT
eukprot:12430762-Karenia_brevis.AAC.1